MSGGRGWEGAAVGEREPVVLASDRRRRGLAVVGVGGDAGVGAHEVLRAVSVYRLRLSSAVCSEKKPREASRRRRRSRTDGSGWPVGSNSAAEGEEWTGRCLISRSATSLF